VSARNVFVIAALIALFQLNGYSQNVGGPITPQIVARVNITGQTGEIPTTILLTPAKDGTYRISAVMIVTTANNPPGGLWYLKLGFSSDAGPITFPVLGVNSSQIGPSAGEDFPFRSNAGYPITYSVIDTGGAQGSTYELFLVIERL
jgi:hypothetical protein